MDKYFADFVEYKEAAVALVFGLELLLLVLDMVPRPRKHSECMERFGSFDNMVGVGDIDMKQGIGYKMTFCNSEECQSMFKRCQTM